ncbi:F0F1 ATP synthase subunit gamma [Anaeromyxobacter sp. PSR-1]|uniref:F0F1 ATP synthase subunit gamma n=1 Tax=Anaeromyxobacter sp. PSR-1 TaxID=1300915 RepID=UPI0005DD0CB4|nr:FoF1 ATP synthase subunit gamma [Anaeromyxobacter sp. PSR-1]GAO02157.1 ATP synthase gamma chain [Anaeromyxobacter sp. PSR-1]
MGKLLELRSRIRAVENIQAVTRTLATVAAAKLALTRRRAAGLRAYAARLREVLWAQEATLAAAARSGEGAFADALLERTPVQAAALLLLTADRGMCGGYNLEICRLADDFRRTRERAGQRVRFVVKGAKGKRHLARRGAEIVHEEGWQRGGASAGDVERLAVLLLELFRSRAADEVWIAYTEFHSPIHRAPRLRRLLPLELPRAERLAVAGAPAPARWDYEPSARELLDELLAIHLRVQLCDALLESYASEQGARMVTMEEATARADTALHEHRVQHNRLRREAITIDLLGAVFAARGGGAPGAAQGGGAEGSR